MMESSAYLIIFYDFTCPKQFLEICPNLRQQKHAPYLLIISNLSLISRDANVGQLWIEWVYSLSYQHLFILVLLLFSRLDLAMTSVTWAKPSTTLLRVCWFSCNCFFNISTSPSSFTDSTVSQVVTLVSSTIA